MSEFEHTGVIVPRFWRDFRAKSLEVKALGAFLVTGRHNGGLPGCCEVSLVALADDFGCTVEDLQRVWRDLPAGFAEYDSSNRVLRIPNVPKIGHRPNHNVIRGWWRKWRSLPESSLKYEHVLSLLEAVPKSPSELVAAAWDETFGTIESLNREVSLVPRRRNIPSALRFEVLSETGFRCKYCGRGAADGVVIEVDHVIPVATGGKTEKGNLVAACSECNQGKSDRPIMDASPVMGGEPVMGPDRTHPRDRPQSRLPLVLEKTTETVGKSSPRARAPKQPDEVAEGRRRVVEHWGARFLERTGQKPFWDGKAFGLLYPLIAAKGADEVCRRIDVLFEAPPSFLAASSPDIGTLRQHFEKLVTPARLAGQLTTRAGQPALSPNEMAAEAQRQLAAERGAR